ncbi:hypothetical protein HHK36_005457 [Tetracentron sinense]|uniref:Uncharacterized protein n=1 Tax=Tetracentron sinense TaxID=13715 RepID=A0A835DR18_TETSI|nr:hypothetical protein HHK36_005457 [Tetracentron sinense]
MSSQFVVNFDKMSLLNMLVSIPSWSLPNRQVPATASGSACASRYVRCIKSTQTSQTTVVRRSGNYKPCIWDYDYVQSLRSPYMEGTYTSRAEKLKGDVRVLFNNTVEPLARLELVDVLQRLGLAYHFEEEIKRALETIYISSNKWRKEDLYATALHFRLLRQHGYQVPQEVFSSFKDKMGNFKAPLCEDTKGMLSLYEASYLSLEGEFILDEAREFTSRHLKEIKENIDLNLAKQVSHALELPLHWRMLRWWTDLGLGKKLDFARDRLMENFLWTLGMIFEPQFGYCRRMSMKVNALITVIDDVYDVYGTLDELELFTDAIERLVGMTDTLHMQFYYLSDHNSTFGQRGDVPKSIQCYMNETGASEEEAREHIRGLISDRWKKMNEGRVADSLFYQTFIDTTVNLARMAQCMYQHGDGQSSQDRVTEDRVLSLLVVPIPLSLP